jgi:hypothetical protein
MDTIVISSEKQQGACDVFKRLPLSFSRCAMSGAMSDGIDPILEGTQTWKLSQGSFIKSDENDRKDIFYPCE